MILYNRKLKIMCKKQELKFNPHTNIFGVRAKLIIKD